MNGKTQPSESANKPLPDQSFVDVFQALLQARKSNTDSLGMLGVCSPMRGVGVSTVAANLAIVAARLRRKRVLLVDANHNYPALARRFRVAASPGFEEAMTGALPMDQCLKRTEIPNLHVLPAEPAVGSATEASPKLTEAFELFSRVFDLVLVDLPVIGQGESPRANVAEIASLMNGIVLIVEPGTVSRGHVHAVTSTLKRMHANVLGVVLNNTK